MLVPNVDERFPIVYIPNFVENADEAFEKLKNELNWKRHGNTPREEYYSNDSGDPYSYGLTAYARIYEAEPWHEEMLKIRSKLENTVNCLMDVCFLNHYLNQKDHLGWHADDSPEMDHNRPIISISLGVERELWFRPNKDPKEVLKVKLEHGSCCIMLPGMQKDFLHRVPKSDRDCGSRISLTFRGYVKS